MIMQAPSLIHRRNSVLRLLALIPMLLLAATRISFIFTEVRLSLQSYRIALSPQETPWVGTKHYAWLLTSSHFLPALKTSLEYGISKLLFGAFLSVIAALLLPKISSAIIRGSVLSAALLFSFLPEQAFMQWYFILDQSLQLEQYTFISSLVGMIHQIGPAVLLGGAGACIMKKSGRGILPFGGALLYIALLLSQWLSGYPFSFELLRSASMPKSLFGLYYQFGLADTDISVSAAIHTIMNILQLLPALLASLFLVLVIRRGNTEIKVPNGNEKQSHLAFLVLCILGVVLWVGAGIYIGTGQQADAEYLPNATFNSFLTLALGFPLFAIYSTTGSLATSNFKRPWISAFFIIFSAVGPGISIEYFFMFRQELSNTVFAPAFYIAISLLPLAAMISFLLFLNIKQGLPYVFPLMGLGAASILTNTLYNYVFISNPDNFGLTYHTQLFYQKVLYYNSIAGYTLPKASIFPSSMLVLLLVSLGIWAFSCIPLFRIAKQISSPVVPPTPFDAPTTPI